MIGEPPGSSRRREDGGWGHPQSGSARRSQPLVGRHLLFGVAFPLRWLTPPSYEHLLAVIGHPISRVVLFLLCMLSLFHFAHRFRYTLYDGLQIKHLNELINTICYGGAIAGSIVAGYLLWQI